MNRLIYILAYTVGIPNVVTVAANRPGKPLPAGQRSQYERSRPGTPTASPTYAPGSRSSSGRVIDSPALAGGYSRESYNALSQKEQREIDQFYSRNPQSPTGVYAGARGEQVTVVRGAKPKTAGEYVRGLEGGVFQPVASPYQEGKVVGVVKGESVDLGNQRLYVTQKNKTTTLSLLPVTAFAQQGGKNATTNSVLRAVGSSSFGPDSLAGFSSAVEAQRSRQESFYDPKKIERIQSTANLLTGGTNLNPLSSKFGIQTPLNDRSFGGQVAQETVYNFMSAPLFIGGGIASSAEKSYLSVRGLIGSETRASTVQELKRSARVTPGFLSEQFNPVTSTGIANIGTVAVFSSIGVPNAKTNPVNRAVLPKLYPEKFTTTESTGIRFVEDVTVPTKLGELKSFEGKTTPTVHVSTAALPREFIAESQPGAGGFRQANKLYGFYKSSPEVNAGKTTPRAYLAYAGIKGDGVTGTSSGRVLFGNPTIRVMQFEDFITPTRKSESSIPGLTQRQFAQSGKTFVPAENIFGASKEGQFVTSSRYVERSSRLFGLMKSEKSIPGFENTPGSLIRQTGDSKYFYYKQKVPRRFFPGTKNRFYKMELIKAETKPVDGAVYPSSSLPKVDLESFGARFSSIRSTIRSPSIGSLSLLSAGFVQPSSYSRSSVRSSLSYLSSYSLQKSPSKSSSLIKSSVSPIISSSSRVSSVRSSVSSMSMSSSIFSSLGPIGSPVPVSPTPPPAFLPPLFGAGRGRGVEGRGRGRSFKYAPSFNAFLFGIKGKRPTGPLSGFETRPILAR